MTNVETSPNRGNNSPPKSNVWRWWLMGVLFLATVLTYLDRQTLGVCQKQICQEFDLNNEQYGDLVASFRWAYALMQLPAGIMADRLPLRLTYGMAVGLWSLAGAAAAFARGFRPLMITRAILGMGESFNWPCASRIVANTFAPSDRSLASGIFNSGAAIGSLIAPTLIGFLALRYGWRAAFFAMGACGTVWLVLWFFATARNSPCHASVRPARRYSFASQSIFSLLFLVFGAGVPFVAIVFGPSLVSPLGRLFAGICQSQPWLPNALWTALAIASVAAVAWSFGRWRSKAVAFWMLLVVTLTVNPCWYFLNDWLFKYLQDARHLDDISIAGMVATLVVATSVFLVADLGNLVSGGAIKYLIWRGWTLRAARGTVMVAVACLIAPVALVTHVENTYAAAALLAGAGMGMAAIIANFTACQQDLSFKRVGLMSGVVGMAANIVSAVANPRIGAYVDHTKSYGLMFTLMGLLPMGAVAAILVFDSVVHRKGRS